ncbi:MAG: ribosome silencing factor [Clostridia bacterium]|nr:ribosome silencing factor [Clostridia bacterium]
MEKLELIIKTLDKKKGTDIDCLKVDDLTILADYFVICTGTSNTHVKSLSDELEYVLGQNGFEPISVTGKASGWILLDYGDVIVDVFTADQREHYALERLWADAKQVDISGMLETND